MQTIKDLMINTLKKLKRIFISTFRKLKKIKNKHKDKLYLSFGENCLTDNILARYNIKSYSTPYSSGRSNIEYILQIENNEFKDFLNPQYMKYDYVDKERVVRLTIYQEIQNKYQELSMNGFEFTHHDVLSNSKLRETMNRRCKRLLNLKNKKLCIFYHNRYGGNTDESMLINHLLQLQHIYNARNCQTEIFMFTQIIVSTKQERKVEHEVINGINVFKFYTLHVWAGTDDQIFWAKCDDDLIKTMIDYAKKI